MIAVFPLSPRPENTERGMENQKITDSPWGAVTLWWAFLGVGSGLWPLPEEGTLTPSQTFQTLSMWMPGGWGAASN